MLVAGLPRVLLFDLDDTILRFSAGQPNFWQLALQQLLPAHADHTSLLAAVERVSREFWSLEERAFWGRQNMHEARRRIAESALLPHGVLADVCHRIAQHMTDAKEDDVRPFDGALETLRILRERGHRLGLLSNGCSAFQRRKLARHGLEPMFELILIEGELGYGKPDRRVYEAALLHFGSNASDTWMIGDNLTADIAGAQAVGIRGIWHDAHGQAWQQRRDVVPDKVITRISQLLET
jgi:putative hydrolase of the HAD superfamily